jgi:CRP-like cAMP-binding protein
MDNGRASLLAALEHGGWPSTAAEDLARAAHLVSFEKDSTIFHAGEAADLVYIVIEGQAKLRYDASAGRSVLVAIAHPGQMLGVVEPAWTVGPSREGQFFTAQAWPSCRVAIIPTARVLRSLRKLAPEQIVRVLERRREEWTRLCCRLLEYLTMSVRSRLTHALGEVADHFGVADDRGRLIDLRLSHEDLAALVGASRPMVSKHLKELESEGALARENGRFLLLSAAKGEARA